MKLPKIYKDLPSLPKAVWLDNKAYSRATQALIPVCCDIVLIDKKQKKFYLAYRKTKPAVEWWFLGGRIFYGESFTEAAVRILFRETKLKIPKNKLKPVTINRFWFKDRGQKPQNIPADTLAFLFLLEINQSQLKQMAKNLNPVEYNASKGLKAFDFKTLKKLGCHPAILDAYKIIF